MWKLHLHIWLYQIKRHLRSGWNKTGHEGNESSPELSLLTADNVSPSGASTVIRHLRRYNRSWPKSHWATGRTDSLRWETGQSFITVHQYCQVWVRFQPKLLSFCYNYIGKLRALLILFMTHFRESQESFWRWMEHHKCMRMT